MPCTKLNKPPTLRCFLRKSRFKQESCINYTFYLNKPEMVCANVGPSHGHWCWGKRRDGSGLTWELLQRVGAQVWPTQGSETLTCSFRPPSSVSAIPATPVVCSHGPRIRGQTGSWVTCAEGDWEMGQEPMSSGRFVHREFGEHSPTPSSLFWETVSQTHSALEIGPRTMARFCPKSLYSWHFRQI